MVFVVCLLGTYLAARSGWAAAAGAGYLAACVLAACCVKPGHLLVAVVTPPLLFAVAAVCVKAGTGTGTLAAITEGTLLTLGGSAPWLFGGTVLALVIVWCRGLNRDIRELSAGLRGDHGVQ